MTEDTQNPKNKSDKKAESTKVKKPKMQYSAPKWHVILSILALILAIIAIFEMSYIWAKLGGLENFEKVVKQQDLNQALRNTELMGDIQSQIGELQQQFKNQSTAFLELKEATQNLSNKNLLSEARFQMLSAKHLVELAQLNLQYQQDVTSSLALLEAAAKQVKETNNAPLQQALQITISQLQNVAQVNKPEVLAKLNQLNLKVLQLPMDTLQGTYHKAKSKLEQSNQSWRTYWQKTLNTFKDLVIIRRQDESIKPLLSKDEQIALVYHLQNQFAEASWALLHNDAQTYQNSLNEAINLIQKNLNVDAQETQNLLTQIRQLKNISLQEKLPDLNHLLQLFDSPQGKID